MQWALVNRSADVEKYGPIDHIFNLIIYDGKAPYTPDPGTELNQVDDDKRIGDYWPPVYPPNKSKERYTQ